MSIGEAIMNRMFDPKPGVRKAVKVLIAEWNPWRSLPIVVMSAEEFDAAVAKQKDMHFGGGPH